MKGSNWAMLAAKDPKPLTVRLLGDLSVVTADGSVFELSWQQPGMLLALIALSPHRAITRDALASALWPEDDGATSRLKLRSVIHRLRRSTEGIPGGFDALVYTDRGDFQLRSDTVETDVAAFEAGFRRALERDRAEERVAGLGAALAWYAGPLAPGVSLPRLDDERARLAALQRQGLLNLARAHQELGRWSTASEAAEKLILVDPTNEEAHLLLMVAFARMGQPSGVLKQFGILEQILHDELGAQPSNETVSLFEMLREEATSIATHAAAHRPPVSDSVEAPPAESSPQPSPQLSPHPTVEPVRSEPGPTAPRSTSGEPGVRGRHSRAGAIAVPALLVVALAFAGGLRLPHPLGWKLPQSRSVTRTQPLPGPNLTSPPPNADNPPPTPTDANHTVAGSTPDPTRSPRPHPAGSAGAPKQREARNAPDAPRGKPTASTVDGTPVRNRHATRAVAAPRVLWTTAYPPLPDERDSEAVAIATDRAGSVITGGFVRTEDHDVDYLTVKYARDGKLLWRRRYNGTGNDVDRAGNIYVVGSSDNGAGNDTSRLSGLDIVTICYDPAGNELWSARYNGPDNGEEEPVRVCVDRAGRVFVAGWSSAGRAGQSPRAEWAILCYDGAGRLEWARRETADRATFAADMVLCPNGDLCVAGHVDHTLRFVPNGDIVLRRYGHDGQEIWERRYGSENNGDEHSSKLCVDAAGNLEVTGVTYTGDPIDAGGAMDILTLKFDADGTRKWVQVFDGGLSMSDLPTGMAVDARGQVYVAGRSAHRSWDYTMLCYSPDGKPVWQRTYNGTSSFDDCAVAVVVDASRNPVFTGFASGKRASDYCTLKLRPDGAPVWRAAFDRAGSGDTAAAVTVDPQNCVVVTGRSTAGSGVTSVTVKYAP